MAGIPTTYAGGEGSIVRRPYKVKGLRNKRRAHWNKIHMAEIREKENKRKALEAEQKGWDNFDFPME